MPPILIGKSYIGEHYSLSGSCSIYELILYSIAQDPFPGALYTDVAGAVMTKNMSLQEKEQELEEGWTAPSSRTGDTWFKLEYVLARQWSGT